MLRVLRVQIARRPQERVQALPERFQYLVAGGLAPRRWAVASDDCLRRAADGELVRDHGAGLCQVHRVVGALGGFEFVELVLREIGVLIVCIMVAGRSGSSYTAELGAMRMREEVDALRTMGFDPVEVLILPRIVALIIAVPALTFLGSMAALYGGGLVSWLYGGIQPEVFLSRLREAVTTTTFEVGMIKAPFMALVIGVVACVEGLQVQGSAESLGEKTTNSVVKSIFLVIVLDGVFAMFFAAIGM